MDSFFASRIQGLNTGITKQPAVREKISLEEVFKAQVFPLMEKMPEFRPEEQQVQAVKPHTGKKNLPSVQVEELKEQTKELPCAEPEVKEPEKKYLKKNHWSEKFVLTSLTYPRLVQKEYIRKKYFLDVVYCDENGKKRSKRVYFGKKEEEDYVDHKDERVKFRRLSNFDPKKESDLFSGNYWRVMLLNREHTLNQAYEKYMKDVGLIEENI